MIFKRKKAGKIWMQYIVYKRKKKLKDWIFCFKKYKNMILTLQKNFKRRKTKKKMEIIKISFRLLNIYQQILKRKVLAKIKFIMNIKKKLVSSEKIIGFFLKLNKKNQTLTFFKIKKSSSALKKQQSRKRNLEMGIKNISVFFLQKINDYNSTFLSSCKSSLNKIKINLIKDSSESTIKKTFEYNLENEKASSHSDSSSSTDPILHKKQKNVFFSEVKSKQSIILNPRESVLSIDIENRSISNSISTMSLSKICFFDDNMKNSQIHSVDEDFFNFGIIDPRAFQNLNFIGLARFFVNQKKVLPPQPKLENNNYRDSSSFSGIPNSDDCFRDLKALEEGFLKYMSDFCWKEGFSKLVCERKKWGKLKIFDEIMNYSSKVYYIIYEV